MLGVKSTETFLFRKGDEPAYKVKSNGKLQVDEYGDLENYDKDTILDAIANLINTKKISKGDKYQTKQGKYDIYRFTYKKEKKDGSVDKYALRVKMSKKYEEEHAEYIKELDSYIQSAHTIRKVNFAKTIAIGTAMTLVMGVTAYGFAVAAERDAQYQYEQNANYVEQLNEERRLENLPPIGAEYKDGRPFEGTYADWAKYISGYTDEFGNVIEEDEPAKTY